MDQWSNFLAGFIPSAALGIDPKDELLYISSMTVEEIISIAEPICQRHRVRKLELFGSYARAEATSSSDLDFCVLFEELSPAEYSRQFFGLLHDLEDTFHSAIDLLTETSIKKESLKESLRKDGVLVYG